MICLFDILRIPGRLITNEYRVYRQIVELLKCEVEIMKKIIVDLMCCQPVAGSKFHGGGEYGKTVFKELCEKHSEEVEILYAYNPDLFFDEWIINLSKEKRIKAVSIHSYEELSNTNEFKSANVFFAPLLTGVRHVVKPAGMKLIAVYHGFRSLEAPVDITSPLYEKTVRGFVKESTKLLMGKAYFKRKYEEMKKTISVCDIIVGVSEHSGYAAKMFFSDYPEEKIKVFYTPAKFVDKMPEGKPQDNSKTILMLGGNRWVKNVYRGIKALDELFDVNQLAGYKVHIVGGIPDKIAKGIHNKDRFNPLGYLSAYELECEYSNCELFFYPTLNEGFGSPPLEAMKYGKTCLVAANSSLIQIYKNSVYYCDAKNIMEMKTRLLQAIEEKIPKSCIRENESRIKNKQNKDLKELCSIIVEL